jgi:hypothetical protein
MMIKYHVTSYFIRKKAAKKAEVARKAKELADLKKKQATNSKSKSSYSTSSIKKKPAPAPVKPSSTMTKQ